MVKAFRMLPVAAALLIPPAALAGQSVSAGALAGFNLVNYTGPSIGGGWEPRLRGGVTVMAALKPKLEVAGEVVFVDLGSPTLSLDRVPGTVGGQPVVIETRNSVRLSQIAVPILVSAVLPVRPDGRVTVRLGGGPALGYRVQCTAKTRIRTLNETGATLSSSTTEDACDNTVRTVDVGVAANAGVRFRLAWGDVFSDARYRVGLTSAVSGVSGRFQQLSIAVGVAFGL